MTTQTQIIPAAPKKLVGGEWGAICQVPSIVEGDTIEITTRAGKHRTATVRQVIWRGPDAAIVATVSGAGTRPAARPADEAWRPRSHRYTRQCPRCDEEPHSAADTHCWECGCLL